MRYPAQQKEQTRKQIVGAAARAFRRNGLHGVGIADLMAQIGLTHGGFYAHFKDRDALVAEAVDHAAAASLCRMLEAADAAAPRKEIEAMLRFYLSPAHRDNFGDGCVLPALASELGRQPEGVRDVFTASLKSNISRIARFVPGTDAKTKTARAMSLISAMAGGVMLARAVSDPKLSNTLLESVRNQLLTLAESWRD